MEHAISASDGLRLVADVFGDATGRAPVVCVPGLTRNARDFTELATTLAAGRRVVAIDLRGRGRSGRDATAQSYTLGVYARDAVEMCADLGISRAVWIGTSLGGLVSMHVGSLNSQLLAGIVLNDIGPELGPAGLARIQSYAGKQAAVGTWAEAAAQVRSVSETQSPGLSDQEWLDEARKRYRETPDGMIAPDYDPAIVSGPPSDVDPWWAFDQLTDVPLLLLRGEFSDLLSVGTAGTMQALHPGIAVVEIPQRGHAPILNEPAAIHAIDVFLDEIDQIWQIER